MGGRWGGRGPLHAQGLCQGELRGVVLGPTARFQGSTVSPGTQRPGPAISYSPAGCSQHGAGMPSPGWSRPSSSHLLSELEARTTPPHPLLGPTSDLLAPGPSPHGHHGAGRGRSHPRAPPQLREGAGWVLAWARRRRDPLLSPAANAKSIRHVSAPRGNRLRPAEGSSQGRGRRLGGSAQGGRPGMCRAKAQKAADTLHPPPQPAPSCPALDPCPEGCGAPAAPGGRRQRVPLRGRAPSGLPALAAPLLALEARIPANRTSLEEAEPLPGSWSLLHSGRAWGGERDPAGRRGAPLGAGDVGQPEGQQSGVGTMPWGW